MSLPKKSCFCEDWCQTLRMSLKPGDFRCAVAIRDGSGLWLTLWVRRKSNGEFFVFWPLPSQRLKFSGTAWNPHTSYHLNGNLHSKSYDEKVLRPEKLQVLTGTFRGTVHLGLFGGHGTGIPCDPAKFSTVIEGRRACSAPTRAWSASILYSLASMQSYRLIQPGWFRRTSFETLSRGL